MTTLFDNMPATSGHLHRSPEERARLSKTHSGMAHWAGSGPVGRTCRECGFWDSSNGYKASSGGGERKPGACRKYRALSLREGPKVPHDAAACKYFDEADKIPPARRPS